MLEAGTYVQDQPMEVRWEPWKLQTCCCVNGFSFADGRMQEEEKLFNLGQQPGICVEILVQ